MQELLREANTLLDEIDATINRMFQAAIDAQKAKEGWELWLRQRNLKSLQKLTNY